MFCKYAERLWEVSESLLGLDIYTEEEMKRLFSLWEDWKKTDYADMTAERWRNLQAMGIHGLRIVPAYKAILDSPQILPYEDPREIVRAQPLITVVSCSCRKHKKMIGNPCRKSQAEANCLQFAKSAEYTLSRGHGRRISVDEALAIVDRNEDDGLVHQWMNHAKIEAAQPYALCSCCRCCCTIWHAADIRNVPNDAMFAKSRYEARVEADLCMGCEDCLERCQFDAIEMRQVEGSGQLKAVVDPAEVLGLWSLHHYLRTPGPQNAPGEAARAHPRLRAACPHPVVDSRQPRFRSDTITYRRHNPHNIKVECL